ncbi:MAG TPA: hypothetical protein VE130_04540 [Nitrososphaeraceae archaeon]|nr:hypothetical protein [Nitrososphaeraceae archaeon]
MHTIIYLNTASLQQEIDQEEEEGTVSGIPVCAHNLSTPVIDQAEYVKEIHYRIGDRMYIENAD